MANCKSMKIIQGLNETEFLILNVLKTLMLLVAQKTCEERKTTGNKLGTHQGRKKAVIQDHYCCYQNTSKEM